MHAHPSCAPRRHVPGAARRCPRGRWSSAWAVRCARCGCGGTRTSCRSRYCNHVCARACACVRRGASWTRCASGGCGSGAIPTARHVPSSPQGQIPSSPQGHVPSQKGCASAPAFRDPLLGLSSQVPVTSLSLPIFTSSSFHYIRLSRSHIPATFRARAGHVPVT